MDFIYIVDFLKHNVQLIVQSQSQMIYGDPVRAELAPKIILKPSRCNNLGFNFSSKGLQRVSASGQHDGIVYRDAG